MDHYKLLGVARNCSPSEIHHAFRELSRKMHPDRFKDKERERAEKEYQLIVKAYNTLKDERLRKEYDKTLTPVGVSAAAEESNTEAQYQQALRAGVAKYNQKQFELASDLLARAIFVKETAEAHYYKGIAEIRLPRRRKSGLDSLQRACELDAFNARYLKSYSRALLEFGLTVRARPVIDRLIELVPDDPEALELQAVVSPDAGKKGGLFSSLFDRFRGDNS
ncbi:MAG: DnaJ domain-containing protein [Acidobacteria bacterium]|nr:DnaJ domain-containing protein [Acidobacteriota bacterium]